MPNPDDVEEVKHLQTLLAKQFSQHFDNCTAQTVILLHWDTYKLIKKASQVQFSLPFDPLVLFHLMGWLDNLVLQTTYMQVQKCCSRGQKKQQHFLMYKFQARQAFALALALFLFLYCSFITTRLQNVFLVTGSVLMKKKRNKYFPFLLEICFYYCLARECTFLEISICYLISSDFIQSYQTIFAQGLQATLWIVVFPRKRSYFMYFNQWKWSLVIAAFKDC